VILTGSSTNSSTGITSGTASGCGGGTCGKKKPRYKNIIMILLSNTLSEDGEKTLEFILV
jgi:hypothetical protein